MLESSLTILIDFHSAFLDLGEYLKKLSTSIDVVIPSLGRSSLQASLGSVFEQSLTPKSVIVVDDSKSQSIRVENYSFPIVVLKTGGGLGPGFARNLGARYANSEWIAFLDDDDKWSQNHLELLYYFALKESCQIAISSARIRGRIRPEALLDGVRHPLIQIYGESRIRKTKHYVPTPGMLVFREVFKKVYFRESLKEREDLMFLASSFEEGFKISQSPNPTALISSHRVKSINRTNLSSDLSWSKVLEGVEPGLGRKFLRGIALRNSIFRVEPLQTLKLIISFQKMKPKLK